MTGRAPATLLACWLVVASPAAHAGVSGPRVTVFRPADAGDALIEVAMRTRAELVSGGFAATIVECSVTSGKCRGTDPDDGAGITATVATFEYGGATLTEVTTNPGGEGARRSVFQVVRAEPNGTEPKVLAIRAVELLRATLLDPLASAPEADTEEPDPAPAAAVAVKPVVRKPPAPPSRGRGQLADSVQWSLSLGATLLQSTATLRDSYGLAVRAGYLTRGGVGLALLFAAVELTPDLQFPEATFALHQELGLVEASFRFRTQARVQPYVTVGLGLYHLGVRGVVTAQPGFIGRSVDSWEVLASGGGGVQFLVLDGWGFFADARAMLSGPEVVLVVVPGDQKSIGGPLLMLSLGLQKIF